MPAAGTFSAVTGRYRLADGCPVDVEAAGASLTLAVAGERPVELTRSSNGRYRLPGIDSEISFELENGSPVMRIHQENGAVTAPVLS